MAIMLPSWQCPEQPHEDWHHKTITKTFPGPPRVCAIPRSVPEEATSEEAKIYLL